MDGASCWRIDVENLYSVWLDPSVGNCPRKLEYTYPDPERWTRIVFRDYQQVDGAIWFPMEQIVEYSQDGGTTVSKVVSTVGEIHVGGAVPRENLLLKFPSGTDVRDEVADATYTVP